MLIIDGDYPMAFGALELGPDQVGFLVVLN
jgi:hypothetical protein